MTTPKPSDLRQLAKEIAELALATRNLMADSETLGPALHALREEHGIEVPAGALRMVALVNKWRNEHPQEVMTTRELWTAFMAAHDGLLAEAERLESEVSK